MTESLHPGFFHKRIISLLLPFKSRFKKRRIFVFSAATYASSCWLCGFQATPVKSSKFEGSSGVFSVVYAGQVVRSDPVLVSSFFFSVSSSSSTFLRDHRRMNGSVFRCPDRRLLSWGVTAPLAPSLIHQSLLLLLDS